MAYAVCQEINSFKSYMLIDYSPGLNKLYTNK